MSNTANPQWGTSLSQIGQSLGASIGSTNSSLLSSQQQNQMMNQVYNQQLSNLKLKMQSALLNGTPQSPSSGGIMSGLASLVGTSSASYAIRTIPPTPKEEQKKKEEEFSREKSLRRFLKNLS